MAISKVSFTRDQGNLATPLSGEDHISALIFDVTTYPGTSADGDMFEIFSVKDAESIGVLEFDSSAGATNYEFGIPHLHISEFFRVNPGASLYIAFADCSSDWDIIDQVQRMAQGKIRQVGVWTRQKLLEPGATVNDPYVVRLTNDMNEKAKALATINQPISILLSANLAAIDAAGDTTNLSLLPDIIATHDHVTALIGQGNSNTVQAIQVDETNNATIGCVGSTLGLVARAAVGDSIAWVGQFDCSGGHLDKVALGFGDVGVTGDKLNNIYPIESITPAQLDGIESKGYVFPMKYVGLAGTYMSSSRTCSNGDYRTIERNRVIDKSRRNMRTVLLPFLNSPVQIAPSTGQISAAQIKVYKAACENVLTTMQDNGEISGFQVRIDPKQNVLLNDTLKITYIIVPKGSAKNIEVTEGFALSTQ